MKIKTNNGIINVDKDVLKMIIENSELDKIIESGDNNPMVPVKKNEVKITKDPQESTREELAKYVHECVECPIYFRGSEDEPVENKPVGRIIESLTKSNGYNNIFVNKYICKTKERYNKKIYRNNSIDTKIQKEIADGINHLQYLKEGMLVETLKCRIFQYTFDVLTNTLGIIPRIFPNIDMGIFFSNYYSPDTPYNMYCNHYINIPNICYDIIELNYIGLEDDPNEIVRKTKEEIYLSLLSTLSSTVYNYIVVTIQDIVNKTISENYNYIKNIIKQDPNMQIAYENDRMEFIEISNYLFAALNTYIQTVMYQDIRINIKTIVESTILGALYNNDRRRDGINSLVEGSYQDR